MIAKFKSLIWIALLLIIGFQFMSDMFDNSAKERKVGLEKLIRDGQRTTGTVDARYIEHNKASIKGYEFDYTFQLNGLQYEGTSIITTLPDDIVVEITYDFDNPNVNSLNPEDDLLFIQDNSGGTFGFMIGLVLFLIGLIWAYYFIKGMKGDKTTDENQIRTENIKPNKSTFKNREKNETLKKSTESGQNIEHVKNSKLDEIPPSDHSRFLPNEK